MLVLKIALVSLLAVFLVMCLVWIIQLRTGNAGIVDIAWSYNFGIVAAVCYFMGDGLPERKLLMLFMVLAWSFRLGTYLFIRVLGHFDTEDRRYQQLRIDWKDNLQFRFFIFFQFQALTNVILSLPFLLMSIHSEGPLTALEWTGFGVWLVALCGEALADYQLKRFKKDPANRGKVCDAGLWNYSRHPNYFFEWMIWIAYFITALSSPYGWLAIISPLLMSYFLLKVTGIPMTEEQAVKSKGEAYIRYQQTTSMFIPWFKKKPLSR
jgi:steroid 5-alpha reductase family enzyme